MTSKKPKKSKKPMTTKHYLAALDALGLTIAGKATAEALGLSRRQIQRISSNEVPVPGPVEKLLAMYLKHGIPKEE